MKPKEFAEYIIRKTVKRIEFKAKDMPLYGKPIVYMALSDDACLYVGMSLNGLTRVFGGNHHILKDKRISNKITSIEVYEAKSDEMAKELELAMIREFKPLFNNRSKPAAYKWSNELQCLQ